MDVGDDVFIKLDKNAEWLLKVVGGAKRHGEDKGDRDVEEKEWPRRRFAR